MATDGPASTAGTPAREGGRPADAAERALPPEFAPYAEESLAQTAVGSPGKVGELDATFAPDQSGETRLVEDYARVPFHLTGTLGHDGGRPDAATVYVQSPTGGLAQGDRTRMHVTAESGSLAHVSTQSATKVLSMNANYARADQTFTVGDDAHLEYVPEQTIVHPDARYCQETAVTLGEDATAFLCDVVVPGRLARGERFDFERYYARTTVDGPDGRILADTTHLAPDDPHADPRAAGILDDYAVFGTAYLATTRDVDCDALSDRLHERSAAEAARAAASTLPRESGVVVRALGDRASDVHDALHAAWDEASRTLLDAPAPDHRKN